MGSLYESLSMSDIRGALDGRNQHLDFRPKTVPLLPLQLFRVAAKLRGNLDTGNDRAPSRESRESSTRVSWRKSETLRIPHSTKTSSPLVVS